MLMLGGGNPAHIPAVEAHFRAAMENLLAQPGAFERAVGDYDAPQGNAAFIAAMAALLRREYGWDVTERNIALTNELEKWLAEEPDYRKWAMEDAPEDYEVPLAELPG